MRTNNLVTQAHNSTINKSPTKPSIPQFDPRALLNPKATTKPAQGNDRDAQDGTKPKNVGMGAMLERMHNVESRQQHRQKKRKVEVQESERPQGEDGEDVSQEQEIENKRKSTFEGGGSGTILGEYVREKQEEGNRERMGNETSIVDLTADDEGDDDLVVLADTGDKEVCLGKVDLANVLAFQVPAPKSTGFKGTEKHWPVMKVALIRRIPSNNNIVISVKDPAGNEFGRLDPKISAALAPLMDAAGTNRLRVVARLEMRRKEPGETPLKPITKNLPVNINLYAPRKMAMGLGRYLGKHQVFLRTPSIPEKVELFNPHAPPAPPKLPLRAPDGNYVNGNAGGNAGYVTRTVEEVRNDVMCMFDALAKSEELPEEEQDSRILTPLLKHQKQALHFLLKRENEEELREDEGDTFSLWRIRTSRNGNRTFYNIITGHEYRKKPPPVLGGILADMMGLGKTLSMLSLIVHTLNEAEAFSRRLPTGMAGDEKLVCHSKGTLLVCPVSTVANWEEQMKTHIKAGTLRCYIYHGSNRTQNIHELSKYDVVLTTYSIIASEYDRSGKRPIQQIKWFRIVLDEAHMIRGQSTKQSQAICALEADRRWAVTGTPVQNRLDDLGALIKFLRIKPFDEKNGFTQYILSPFKNADPEILPKLRLLVDSITLRRLKDRIDLPPRVDQIVKLDFSSDEKILYDLFAKDSQQKVRAVTNEKKTTFGGKAYVHILQAILRLRLICAHGQELLSDEDMKLTEGLSYSNAIDLGDEDDDRPALSPKQAYDMFHLLRESDMDRCSTCSRKVGQEEVDDANEAVGTFNTSSANAGASKSDDIMGYMTPCYQILCPKCIDQFKALVAEKATSDNRVNCPICDQYIRVSFFELSFDKLREDEEKRARIRENPKLAKKMGKYGGPHTKTKVLIDCLKRSQMESATSPDEEPLKSVIFSGWTAHLDLIQLALEEAHLPFTRLDGSMSRPQRTNALHTFRTDPAVPIILVSIGAGGLGLNLTTASRAYVMEPQFNPAAEAQAVDRVHRLGQTRPVMITRFIMNESFEEKMLVLQQKKRDLADLSMNRNVKLDKAEAAKKRLEELRSLFR